MIVALSWRKHKGDGGDKEMAGVRPWQVVVIIIGIVAIVIVAWQAWKTFKPPAPPPTGPVMTGFMPPGPYGPAYGGPGPTSVPPK